MLSKIRILENTYENDFGYWASDVCDSNADFVLGSNSMQR